MFMYHYCSDYLRQRMEAVYHYGIVQAGVIKQFYLVLANIEFISSAAG